MNSQLASIRLEVRPRHLVSTLDVFGAQGELIVLDDEADWHYTLQGPWAKKRKYYEAHYGLLNEVGVVVDGFTIKLNCFEQIINVIPSGIGQLRCFLVRLNDTLIISSQPTPLKDERERFEKGRFEDIRQSHALDWANFYGSGMQLRHGEELTWHKGRLQSAYAKKFYPAQKSGLATISSREQAANVLRQSLTEATQRALLGHDKVALHISGGIDSAAVAAAAAQLAEQDRPQLKIFSWQVNSKTADESRFIREIAQKLDIEFELVRPASELSAYDPDTLEATIEPLDSTYNPFRFLVGAVLERSAQQGFHYGLNGNAGDNLIALPSHYALVEAWQNREFGEFYRMVKHLVNILGISNLSKVQAVRRWVRYIRGSDLFGFSLGNAGEYEQELNGLKELVLNWPPTLDKRNPKHASYWKLVSGDGLFPVASALTYSSRLGCFAHTPYFDYEFVLRMKDIPSYYFNYPYRFKTLSRAAFVGILPDSITQRPYRRGNLNPIMDQGYTYNRLRLRDFLMDKRAELPTWHWWDKLDQLLQQENEQPLRGDTLFFLNKAIVRIVNTQRMIEAK